ncbi:hypothetical protein MUY_000966 [Bacillus licheniformis WX-02]|nr:hypothetical protein MUY_000966 [Bacillus licheniformis WX-02]
MIERSLADSRLLCQFFRSPNDSFIFLFGIVLTFPFHS